MIKSIFYLSIILVIVLIHVNTPQDSINEEVGILNYGSVKAEGDHDVNRCWSQSTDVMNESVLIEYIPNS